MKEGPMRQYPKQNLDQPRIYIAISKTIIKKDPPARTRLRAWFEVHVSSVFTADRTFGRGWRSASAPVNHLSPPRNISRDGNTSKISHSKWGMTRVYFLQSCEAVSPPAAKDEGVCFSSSFTAPKPTERSSKAGTFSSRRNICPIAYFSWRKR